MVKILGLLDIIATLLLVGTAYNFDIPREMIIGISAFLFLKGLIFFCDIGSMFDIAAGILLILSLSMTLPPLALYIAAGLVGLKGIMSLFA